ncbi:MAG: LysR family transcriptional regulator [Nocardioides sp.]
MHLDLTAVQSFIAVADRRHFGRAAERLEISVSALTKRIQRLESSLGVPLIERDSGGFTGLTPAGRRFIQFAPHSCKLRRPLALPRLALPSRHCGSRFLTASAWWLGGLGTAIVAACEVWSALVAKTDVEASVIGALNTSYAVSSIVIIVGTLGAGIALHATKSRFALPLLVSGGFFLVAVPVRFLASDGFGIAALTIWSLLYIWLGIRLGVRRKVGRAPELV